MRTFLQLIPFSFLVAGACFGQSAQGGDTGLVLHALSQELRAAQDTSHPMRYRMRKTSPRLTTTKELIETRDGIVAMLLTVNDKAPSPADDQKEQARLDGLLGDPGKQRHRKQSQDEDTARALEVLRVMPRAFLYQHAATVTTPSGVVEKFAFTPNPKFDPPDLQTQVLTAMKGEIWIDAAHGRVVHLEGRLQQDVDVGWGILGRLYKGGWIMMDQAEVAEGQWRVVRFKMSMTARMVIRTRTFETAEEQSQFVPVPAGLNYRQGIQMLRSGR